MRRTLGGWALILVLGACANYLSWRYHLQSAPFNPLLPYLVGTLIFAPAWQAGVAFLIATAKSTSLQLRAPGTPLADNVMRVLLIMILFALIVLVKERLRRRNDERLRLLQERGAGRLQAVLDAAPEPMVVTDEGRQIVMVNNGLEQLTGYERTALVGHPVEMLVPPPLRAQHSSDSAAYIAQPSPRPMGQGLDLELVRADGTTIPVEISLSPYHDDERLLVVAVVVDISVRREQERQRMAALLVAEDAELRASIAEQRAHDRSVFMSAAAHELRTPLTALRGYSEIALSALLRTAMGPRDDDPDVYSHERMRIQRSLPAIMRQTEKLERLVGLLLDVGHLERGNLGLDAESVDLAGIVREAIQNAQVVDSSHPINAGGVAGELHVVCDALRIEQVLINLLTNAQQYSPAGHSINVSLCPQDGGALVCISDEGPGIPPGERERVFERFYQIGRTERSVGLGLGLFLARSLVELHGGSVSISDGPHGKGTTVSVWLPLVPPQTE